MLALRVKHFSYLLDHGQYPRLRVVVTVSTNTQIHLLRIRVLLERGHQPKQRVLRRLRDDVGAKRRLNTFDVHIDGTHMALYLSESVVCLLFRYGGPGDVWS
ncbi:hypothetical protein KC354_g18 [Hortaea werneckii]|nr:hypothetical protein KC354_g18 [Hortaea werneckii]